MQTLFVQGTTVTSTVWGRIWGSIAQRSAKRERLAGFIRMLETQKEPVAEFDERLWGAMVDCVTVGVDGGMAVVFRDGDFLRQDKVRRMRRLLRSQGLALHRQVPQGHLPLQQEVQREEVPNTPWVICRWHITEEEIKAAFVTAFNRLVTEREEIIANARLVRQTLCDTTALAEEKAKLQQELAVLVEMTEKAVRENACIAQDQEEYQRHYNSLVERYDATKARFDKVTEAISAKESKAERLAMFERTLAAQGESVAEFDSQLWASMVECVTVEVNSSMTVVFRDGTERRL